jgi:hypothetical protein
MLVMLKAMDASPLALCKGIVLNLGQVYLLFGCMIAVVIFVSSKKKAWLYTTLSLFILFQIAELQEKRKVLNQHIILVYNTKNLMIHLINNRTNYLITNKSEKLSESENKTLERVCSHLKLDQTKVISFDPSKSVNFGDLVIRNKSIQFINSRLNLSSSNKYNPNTDQVELTIYPEKPDAKPIAKAICVGNTGFGQKPGAEIFKIKQEGAFYANLKTQ